MILADTHCHLIFDQYDQDRDSVIARARDVGVDRILIPGIDLLTSHLAVQMAEDYPEIFAAVGVHPNSSLVWKEGTVEALEKLTIHPEVVAIGEIGLDYYRDWAPRNHQKRVFKEQLNLAGAVNLPVVIHTRNANQNDRQCISDLIKILTEWKSKPTYPGVIHSFSGDETEARQLLEMDFYIGITGPVTYKNAMQLRQVVASIPLDRLLLETDGPFLAPHPHRGKRNEPAYVSFIAEKISDVHNCSLEVVARQTSKNAEYLFRWKDVG